MNFKKFVLELCMLFCFSDIIKFEDFDFDNILINEKVYKNILIYNILYRALIGPKPQHIRFDKINGFIRVYNVTLWNFNDMQYYLALKNMMSFTIGLDSFM